MEWISNNFLGKTCGVVLIPIDLISKLNIEEGDRLRCITCNDRIVLEKVK